MHEANNPGSGLQDQSAPLKKALEDEEERRKREQMQKALTDHPTLPQSGLHDPSKADSR